MLMSWILINCDFELLRHKGHQVLLSECVFVHVHLHMCLCEKNIFQLIYSLKLYVADNLLCIAGFLFLYELCP